MTGARPWCTPAARMDRPIRPAISSTSSGSNAAPQLNGAGYTVACQAQNPVRHSSWTRAGMPNRLLATICACAAASERAPADWLDGCRAERPGELPEPVPDDLVERLAVHHVRLCGATPAPEASAPTQMPASWATFSSSVISGISAAARSAGDSRVSRQRAPSPGVVTAPAWD